MKRFTFVLFVFLLFAATALPCLGEEAADRVIDNASLLSTAEEAALNERLAEISLRQQVDIAVATTEGIGDLTVAEYSDNLYEALGFGFGESHDGLILVISMENRDWYISTEGYGIKAFTDAGIEYIGDQITPELSAGNYASAFNSFATLCDKFITQAKEGEPFDRGSLPREPLSLIWIPISLLVGFVIASIVVGGMKAKLKTVGLQRAANSYVKSGSLSITESRDLFLFRTVTRTPRPKSTSGGSSTHSSASGRTHGGGGGRF